MTNAFEPPTGLRYDPPRLTLESADFDDGAASYASPAVHVMQPRSLTDEELALPAGAAGGPNPYVDYSRRFTAEGGIALSYKTKEFTFWQFILRVTFWSAVMGTSAWLLLHLFAYLDDCTAITVCAYTGSQWGYGGAVYAVGGLLLALLLMQPSYAIHTIEIRPDCLILDGSDVFWAAHMEARPAIQPDELGGHTLRGIYGTRYMEFLTLRPVDANDATPAVLANHIEAALTQLWDQPQVWAGD